MDIIAHRGASGYAPENTLAAFRKALRLGAKAVEFDVQQTKDNILVVIHDFDLRRVGGVAKKIKDLLYHELVKVDVGSWFSNKFSGEHVPLLSEVLEALRHCHEIQLEVKKRGSMYGGIERRIVRVLRQQPVISQKVIISSFDYHTLMRLRQYDSSLRLGYLVRVIDARVIRSALSIGCESIHPWSSSLTYKTVQAVHRSEMLVRAWGAKTVRTLRRLKRIGVDAATYNYPNERVY